MLMKGGYADIGMDHFALPTDELFKAWSNGKLHRNFMGYTTQNAGLLLGLGVSSISDTGNAFAQNEKTLHDYYASINAGRLSIKRGFILNKEDESFRQYILDIACKGKTSFKLKDLPVLEAYTFPRLAELERDSLVEWNSEGVTLTAQGHYFIRNVCSVFDLYLQRNTPATPIFSKAI